MRFGRERERKRGGASERRFDRGRMSVLSEEKRLLGK